ncbi:MAG: glycoside hydrolase family 99-like domain-containing protein [Parabacteroides sp.]
MNRTKYAGWCFLTSLVFGLLTGCCHPSEPAVEKPVGSDYIVAAYIWPSCHDDSLAHTYLWDQGEGEWEIIKKGNPRFEGHYQPRQPLWGYEPDNDPQVVERWINTALAHGVNTFVYDWYWFKNGPYLESALNDGFLKAPSNRKMNFYIMWANHTVVHNYWNYHKYGDDTSVLFDPKVDWENFKIVVDRVIRQYFTQPNYLKFEGCPVMAIFDYGQLVNSFGSIEETRKALDYFREQVKAAGFPGVHFQMNPGGGYFLNDDNRKQLTDLINGLGVNSVAFYNMGGFNTDYLVHCADAVEIRKQWDEALDVPIFPTVSIGWDDTPRFPAKGADDVTRFHNTPTSFATYLAVAKEFADTHPDQPKMMMINAWNEWVEGSYLLPDHLNGFGYLEAVRDVMQGKYDKASIK